MIWLWISAPVATLFAAVQFIRVALRRAHARHLAHPWVNGIPLPAFDDPRWAHAAGVKDPYIAYFGDPDWANKGRYSFMIKRNGEVEFFGDTLGRDEKLAEAIHRRLDRIAKDAAVARALAAMDSEEHT